MKKLNVFVLITALLVSIFSANSVLAASPPEPTYGNAIVDGNYNEWDLSSDYFADMYRAGNPAKELEAKAYFRYDASAETVYVLVLDQPGIPAMADTTDYNAMAWSLIVGQNSKVYTGNSGNDGIPSDFAWIGLGYDGTANHAQGYEASFKLAPGSYKIVTHIEVFDSAASQTAATIGFPKTGMPLVLNNNGAVIPTESPAITVTAAISGAGAGSVPYIPAGEAYTREYTVANTGNVTLTDIIVTNAQGFQIGTIPSLAPGESVTFTVNDTAAAGQQICVANAAAAWNGQPVTAEDAARYFGALPSVSIVTSVNGDDANTSPGPYLAVGETVNWEYTVTNTGNVTLTNVAVKNDQGIVMGTIPVLAPGESAAVIVSETALQGQHTSSASAIGLPPAGLAEVSSTIDPANYYGVVPSVAMVKYVSVNNGATWLDANAEPVPQIQVGQPVIYKFIVTNTGEVALENIAVIDDKVNAAAFTLTSPLAPGAVAEWITSPVPAVYGYLTNTATVTGYYHNRPYTSSDIAQYFGALTTYTQGGFQGKGLPGQIFNNNFKTVFPAGLTIGAYNPANSNIAPNGFLWEGNDSGLKALKAFLADGGTSTALANDAKNPATSASGGTLARQTAALTLNIKFSGVVAGMPGGLGNLIYSDSASSLNGKSVNDILAAANTALASGELPAGYSFGTLNTLVAQLNTAFDNGKATSWAQQYLK